MNAQLTNTIVMVSPSHFGFNEQTASSNPFQHSLEENEAAVQARASHEFNGMVEVLRNKGVHVLVLRSREDIKTPDSIFPNNWFSHHDDGTLIVYPMLAENRRAERQIGELRELLFQHQIPVSRVIDLTAHEQDGYMLEGTGSLVLERSKKVAFAMESPRTTRHEFDIWCRKMGYKGIFFRAYDEKHFPVYHTNVTMNIGREFAVVCLESITDTQEQEMVVTELERIGKTIIPITKEQMGTFCGNILQLETKEKESIIVMSDTAYFAFTPDQKHTLEQYGEIVHVAVPTVETVGGGSARCMMAEVFH
jgi:hypothetical protein